MNKRTVSMIHELCDSKENSLEKLAEKFQVSQRTIRNDLNLINDLLKENSLGAVELMKGGIIQILGDFEKIKSLLSGDDFYEYKLSKEERKKLASAMLVNAAGFLTSLRLRVRSMSAVRPLSEIWMRLKSLSEEAIWKYFPIQTKV